MKKLWGTRFKKGIDSHVEKLISSLSFDVRLAVYDVEGSIAHAQMLGDTGTIKRGDARQVVKGLERISSRIVRGTLKPDPKAEDVHTWIQSELTKEVGGVGADEHVTSDGDRDGTLRVLAHGQAGNLQIRGLFLNASGVRDDRDGLTHHFQEVEIAERLTKNDGIDGPEPSE